MASPTILHVGLPCHMRNTPLALGGPRPRPRVCPPATLGPRVVQGHTLLGLLPSPQGALDLHPLRQHWASPALTRPTLPCQCGEGTRGRISLGWPCVPGPKTRFLDIADLFEEIWSGLPPTPPPPTSSPRTLNRKLRVP